MRRLTDYLLGACVVRLRGCEPERCLDALLDAGIPFRSVTRPDEFTLVLRIRQADAPNARAAAERCHCEVQIDGLRSLRRDRFRLKKRRVLLLGLPAVLALAVFLSNFVVQIRIQGCETLDETQVRRALDTLGVRFGAWGPGLDSEEIRYGMLRLLPSLRWAGVNWSGMRAEVQVAEREQEAPSLERTGASDLVACTEGVVTKVVVWGGQAACAPGDAVAQGQVLISGTVDLERLRVTTRALGEVYADTRRTILVKTPAVRTQRVPEGASGLCLWLRVGRKRIKIFGNSGIVRDGCVKMINRGTMRLPGGVEVPLELCVETFQRISRRTVPVGESAAAELLENCADRLIDGMLVAGRVTSAESAMAVGGGVCCLTKTVHCSEMIARSAEIPILELEQHGETDQRGTDGTAH